MSIKEYKNAKVNRLALAFNWIELCEFQQYPARNSWSQHLTMISLMIKDLP